MAILLFLPFPISPFLVNGGGASAFDFAVLYALQGIGSVAGQSLQQVALRVAAVSRGYVVTSTFILPAVSESRGCDVTTPLSRELVFP